MEMPNNLSEEEVLATIDIVAHRLGYKYRFGYHDVDDMKQQARIFALEGLRHYDGNRPLENFLWTHVRNRLFNFKRDKYERLDKPCCSCAICAKGNNGDHNSDDCEYHIDKSECSLYASWITRNSCKKNLMRPIDFNCVKDEHERNMSHPSDVVESASRNELLRLVDIHLSLALRSDYIKLQHGLKVSKQRRIEVNNAILTILKQYGVVD